MISQSRESRLEKSIPIGRGLLLRCADAIPVPPHPETDKYDAWYAREDVGTYTAAMVTDTLTQLCRRFG